MLRSFRKILLIFLAGCLLLSLFSCRRAGQETKPKAAEDPVAATEEKELPVNLVASYQKNHLVNLSDDVRYEREKILCNYGWRLYSELLTKQTPGDNQLFSPLSLEFALCMVANGAVGETRREIENAIGLSVKEMNEALCGILSRVENNEFGTTLLANSVWMRDDESFTVKPEFLQTVADYYNAQIYKEPLDNVTCEQLNAWVEEYTRGMIPKLLDNIDPDTVMLLVNVLTFEHSWATPYEEHQVQENQTFRNYDNSQAKVTMLSGSEHGFVEGNGFTGFVKAYEGPYAILFLLPDEGLDVYETMGALSGEDYLALSQSADYRIEVTTKIPEFSYDCTYDDLISPIRDTGIDCAFSQALADFSDLGRSTRGNIFIDLILQKTHIELNRNGTKAAAATVISLVDGIAMPGERREVILDRPFGYVIFDTTTQLPLFLGVTATLK